VTLADIFRLDAGVLVALVEIDRPRAQGISRTSGECVSGRGRAGPGSPPSGSNLAIQPTVATPDQAIASSPTAHRQQQGHSPESRISGTAAQSKTPGSFLLGVSLRELSDDRDQKLR
jgi:hypothetical protein